MARILTTKKDGTKWEILCTERQVRGWVEILKQRFKIAHRTYVVIQVIHDSGDVQTIRWEKPQLN